jgi:hypothetical protein
MLAGKISRFKYFTNCFWGSVCTPSANMHYKIGGWGRHGATRVQTFSNFLSPIFRRLGDTPEIWLTMGHPGLFCYQVRAGVYLKVATPRYDHSPQTGYWRLLDANPCFLEMATER